MPSWQGDPTNPVPNFIGKQEQAQATDSSRVQQIRRDTDKQKDFTITYYDIDETILTHLNNLQLQVQDSGQQVKVPVFYGSPEQWTSAQRDGYLRDKQGKVILPLVVFKRVTSEDDQSMAIFNRHLMAQVSRLYSEKNKYTQFSVLTGQNAPINEVYNIVIPDHVVLTYHFILWTEKVEQMNDLVLKFQFNTGDYWGTVDRFKFRTRVESFSHTVEVTIGEDRVIKTEFDLVTHAYVLPDTVVNLDQQTNTIKKMLSPKKVIIGAEVVQSKKMQKLKNANLQNWHNPSFPNLPLDLPIPAPPISVQDLPVTASNQ